MTMGMATVASTKVRTTGERSRSQSPSSRFNAVRVGKTASQIMTASWCLVGGPTGRGLAALLDMVLPRSRWVSGGGQRCSGGLKARPAPVLVWSKSLDGGAAVEVLNGPANVVVDEGGVHRDGGRGPFAGCGD